MAFNSPVAVEASSAKTATGNSAAAITIDDPGSQLALLVNVSAVSGPTPTLDLKVQWSHDGGTTWADAEPIDSLTHITAPKEVGKIIARKAPHVRLFWPVGAPTPTRTIF